MAPTRRNPPPSETNYGSDVTLDHQKHTNYGDVIKIVVWQPSIGVNTYDVPACNCLPCLRDRMM